MPKAQKNPQSLVKTAAAQFEQNIPKQEREEYDRIVLAGMKLMNDENTFSNLQLVKSPNARNDIPGTVSKGIAGLIYILFDQSKNKDTGEYTMRAEPAVLAGMTLMFKALDLAERGLGVQITKQVLDATVEATAEQVLRKLGVTPEMMDQAVAEAESRAAGATPKQPQPQRGVLGA